MVNFTNEQRIKLLERSKSLPKISQKLLAVWAKEQFNLSTVPAQSSVSEAIAKAKTFKSIDGVNLKSKKQRTTVFPALDRAIVNWVLHCESRGVRLKGDLIILKAKRLFELAGISKEDLPAFSNGWLDKFKKRHGFKSFQSHGESGSVDMDVVRTGRELLKDVTSQYPRKDIFNMDETGLFYNMAPDRTIASRQTEGVKQDKTRITIALTTNADGSEYISPLFIGHANKPRCFKKKTGSELGFEYKSNTKAWMTALFFQDWLKAFDRKMSSQARHVLLLLDSAPFHIIVEGELTNTKIHMLPPNTTSKLQPMDSGIIAAFKKRYRHRHMSNAVDRDENGEVNLYKVDQLTAMKWSIEAWKDVSATTISNCWNKVDIIGETVPVAAEVDTVEEELNELIRILDVRDPMTMDEFINPECEVIVEEMVSEAELISDKNLRAHLDCAGEIEVPDELDDYVIQKPIFTKSEKLAILTKAIDVLNDSDWFVPENDCKTIARLWKEKRDLRHSMQNTMKQLKLTHFFDKSNANIK
jgi:hypothetical protein